MTHFLSAWCNYAILFFMNTLQIYPTSRALRSVTVSLRETEGFLPALMRMDEFERRAVLVEGAGMVDPLWRILLLREAADFRAFERLKIDRDLVRFFTRGDAIFKFFEELSSEGVSLEMLAEADAYAEFGEHLEVLGALRERYRRLLLERGLTDRMFLPEHYRINEGFIRAYEKIEIHLEGYLSHFELALLEQITKITPVVIHYRTSRFTRKMLERFAQRGIMLEEECRTAFVLGSGEILYSRKEHNALNVSVLCVEERDEQVALALWKIEEMVRSGIDPSDIVLVLPDESFKSHFMLFDRLHNLNFAMGYDYSEHPVYRSLETIYAYWRRHDDDAYRKLVRYGIAQAPLAIADPQKKVTAEAFFALLAQSLLLDLESTERLEESYRHFLSLFKEMHYPLRTWMLLWLERLGQITLDDVRGGKVTVMGVLETRGVSFEGVVIVDFNDTIVPASSSKDLFLNSQVRMFAGLPTRGDREALQKHYYYRLLSQAKVASVIYATAENRLPSKFLYELGLEEGRQQKAPIHLLYDEPSQLLEPHDPVVEVFDAQAQEWSPSRLKTFLECKRKYYYRYLRDLKPKEDETLNEGTLLHQLLEALYKERDHYEDQETLTRTLFTLMERLLPGDDAPSRYQKALWREKLKGFIDKEIAHFAQGWRVLEREKEVSGEIGGLRFKGRIDRIDTDGSEVLVLDYKSGSVPSMPKKPNPDTLTDFQMDIYAKLLSPRFPDLSLAYVKILEKGERIVFAQREAREEILNERIVELKQTTRFVASRCETLSLCTYCEFALMCGRGEYLSST